jgi:tetratricopeptide (TPR) repeat protein
LTGLKVLAEGVEFVDKFVEEERKKKQAGSINGKYYTEYIDLVRELKREKKHQEAIDLLLRLIDAVECEAKVNKSHGGDGFCAPWYYEQVAIIYRKEKRYSEEIAIVERLQEQNNYLHESAVKRLKKAKELQNMEKAR